jgi:transcriptional regulator
MPRRKPDPSELIPGTLDMLVLKTLMVGRMHGYAIGQHIARLSEDVLKVEQGSLYPALERLLDAGYVTAKWEQTPQNRRARYYTITATGKTRLGADVTSFDRALLAFNRVMGRA